MWKIPRIERLYKGPLKFTRVNFEKLYPSLEDDDQHFNRDDRLGFRYSTRFTRTKPGLRLKGYPEHWVYGLPRAGEGNRTPIISLEG